jgi:hypothetical protein
MNMALFHTKHHSFQLTTGTVGQFPFGLSHLCASVCTTASGERYSREDQVLIAGYKDDHLTQGKRTPELWRYSLRPEQEIHCVDVAEKLKECKTQPGERELRVETSILHDKEFILFGWIKKDGQVPLYNGCIKVPLNSL